MAHWIEGPGCLLKQVMEREGFRRCQWPRLEKLPVREGFAQRVLSSARKVSELRETGACPVELQLGRVLRVWVEARAWG